MIFVCRKRNYEVLASYGYCSRIEANDAMQKGNTSYSVQNADKFTSVNFLGIAKSLLHYSGEEFCAVHNFSFQFRSRVLLTSDCRNIVCSPWYIPLNYGFPTQSCLGHAPLFPPLSSPPILACTSTTRQKKFLEFFVCVTHTIFCEDSCQKSTRPTPTEHHHRRCDKKKERRQKRNSVGGTSNIALVNCIKDDEDKL